MTDRAPWRCPDCGGVIAPHVDVHFCGNEPDGGSPAKLPVRPQAPPMVGEKSPEPAVVATGGTGGASTVTWTFPPGTVYGGGGGGAGGHFIATGGPVTIVPGTGAGGGGAGSNSAVIAYGGPGGGETGNAA